GLEIVGGHRAGRGRGSVGIVFEGGSRGSEIKPATGSGETRRFAQTGLRAMTPEQAIEQLDRLLAHLWMVRTFLKHAEEIQDDTELLEVPRTLFDSIRAVEPARERGDHAEFLNRLSGKLPKIRRVAEMFQREHKRASDHTNFHMAAQSLMGCV